MALPFTPEQMNGIRQKLYESAQRHARDTGVKKTSLDMLTADAGISKSSFYKFYESKELLFLEVAADWETQILSTAAKTLSSRSSMSNKARAAAFVYAVFETIHHLGIARFLREDLPHLSSMMPETEAREHCLTSARSIFCSLCEAQIRFTAPEETVLSVIQFLYLSILNTGNLGDGFLIALQTLVQSACDRLVA